VTGQGDTVAFMAMRRRRARAGMSLIEVAAVLALMVLIITWTLPRFRGEQIVAGDRTAQTDVELAFEAALAAKREIGRFPDTSDAATNPGGLGGRTLMKRYMIAVPLVAADTTTLVPGQVSVRVSPAGSGTTATVYAAAVTADGTCWLAQRSFGTSEVEVLYAAARSVPCNATRAVALSVGDDERGDSWTRPLVLP
jgi:type II secretory pathway pseudopilin PulG